MIKGNGTLEVTHATVIMALQEYFDARIAQNNPIRVTKIALKPNTYGIDATFVIDIEELKNDSPTA